MKIYFSVDPEVGGESVENLKKLMRFLQGQDHIIYRAPYQFSDNPDFYLSQELGLNRQATYEEQRRLHMKWIDNSDLLLAEVSAPSEGRAMIIQRALDKPLMGLPYTPIILIKGKKFEREFGKIVRGLIESGEATFYEYDTIDDVIVYWPEIVKKASSKNKG